MRYNYSKNAFYILMDVVEFKVIIDPDDKLSKSMFEQDKMSDDMLRNIEKLSEFKWSSKNL